MRTTVEIKSEHRAELLELAARRGSKGLSALVAEALEVYLELEAERTAQRKRAALLKGSCSPRRARICGMRRKRCGERGGDRR